MRLSSRTRLTMHQQDWHRLERMSLTAALRSSTHSTIPLALLCRLSEPHLVHYNINKLCPWTHNRNKTSLFFCSPPLLPPGTNPLNASSPLSSTFSKDFLFVSNLARYAQFFWFFCAGMRQFESIAAGGEHQDAKMAPKCDGYWSCGGIFTACKL